jgi:prepilin-type N-terminal cleavage/methylation domain-containing protein
MVQKYTILKQLIQNSSRVNKSTKGFTLIELIVGLSIMLIVGGLAMNAFLQASTSFNKDKRSIDSSQNLSTILEIIGTDIRQAGESISDSKFPTIEFKVVNSSDPNDSNLMSGSSKIIVRRALTSSLTLCQNITAAQSLTGITDLIVGDSTQAATSSNCGVATSSNPLSVYRVAPSVTTPVTPTTYYPPTVAVTNPYPSTRLALTLPVALRTVRDYRCELDDPNPTTAYNSASNASTDFCATSPPTPTLEKLRIAVSDANGRILIFNETNETADSGAGITGDEVSPPVKKYRIAVNSTFSAGDLTAVPPIPPDPAIKINSDNRVEYGIGSPIYVIEERVYTLTNKGYFQVSIDGKPPDILIKKIDNFRVSARQYTDSTTQTVNPTPTPTSNLCTDATPFAAQPTTATVNSPKYICQFNYFTTTGATDNANWKTLAGIKIELQAKYDGTGKSATASTEDTNKLYAAAEFFPRNVLSK